VPDDIHIQSHKGRYSVNFRLNSIEHLIQNPIDRAVFIIDKNISQLYDSKLDKIFQDGRYLTIEATESNKSLDKIGDYIESLMGLNIKRNDILVAIGGGIIQDITCFLATTLMRGLPWVFYPTTLLAQSDSCIGSKSSINSGSLKNILGTFTPPEKIVLDVNFLKTLEKNEIYSGIGEMIKVHAIDSLESFEKISDQYQEILLNPKVMEVFIRESLLMKKKLIEVDEFDQGPRNVMNYGHSFGHAIESATNYSIPHGIAVTIGMDLANYVAVKLNISSSQHFDRMHKVLNKNCMDFRKVQIDVELLMNALLRDKKNTTSQLRLILPDKEGRITIGLYDKNLKLREAVESYFELYQVEK